MNRLLLLLAVCLMFPGFVLSQKYTYSDSWDQAGYNLKDQSNSHVSITYSIRDFTISDITIRGEKMKEIGLPNHFLPNDAGAPNLPGSGRYIAVPQGATAVLHILDYRTEVIKNVLIAPAPVIPKETDRGPLVYEKDMRIYSNNDYYPSEPIKLSEPTRVRGVDAVILGITPFKYNPVTRELIVYRDIRVEIEFTGGNGHFGENRYRSRWWDPIMEDLFINQASLPKIDYSKRYADLSRATGYEYLIICPNDPAFLQWADTIRNFRTMQGIYTGIVTTSDIGGNTVTEIESYINNAYQTWDIPPAAILLLGDFGTSGNTIISPIWDSYCVSDHIYADVDNNDEEEIVLARITAQNAAQLEVMVRKFVDYETNPPTNPGFYNHPITALGWQTERWFQICSEVASGYFKNGLGKDPLRVNAVYMGNPDVDPWSTAPNTQQVLDYFGPDGMGYIPATPAEIGGFSGGTPAMVNAGINSGAFLLQHRDHGFEYGWGEPAYDTNSIDGCTNTDLTFVLSINCLTGKYNLDGEECFAEKFHRYTYNGHPSGALGLIAASEVSYSFVNDTYLWGLMDNMWPDFMPSYGTTPPSRGELPAFGNAAGKFFLKYSSWPYNSTDKEVTYNLFHHHGDAFLRLFSEVPQNLTVIHNPVMLSGLNYFTVQADEGSLIALSVAGQLIGVADGTGAPVDIAIAPQLPPSVVDIVVTKQNYYRYHTQIQVSPPEGPFVIHLSNTLNDANGNNNGQLDYGESVALSMTLKNLGSEEAQNVQAELSTSDEFVNITSASASFGTIPPGDTATVTDGYAFEVTGNVPDKHLITFHVLATNGDTSWNSSFTIIAHAPILSYVFFTIADTSGNNNGRLDPGETAEISVSVRNTGSADAYNVYGILSSSDPYITIGSDSAMFGNLPTNGTLFQTYNVSAALITPAGHEAAFTIDFTGDFGAATTGHFNISIGQFPILVIDLDENHSTGPNMKAAIDEWRIGAEYQTSIPADLSIYKAIFLDLGTYTLNHVLMPQEAAPFVDFLNAGGKLYMEGADTWYYDQLYNPTPLHPMFDIQGLSDGTGDLTIVKGKTGTFTDGMSLAFSGDNNYIDHISPISPGFSIFYNNEPVYDIAVAYDAGTYKTIGSSFEFGGLLDNLNYTKKDVMLKYLQFFGLQPITEIPETPSGETSFCGPAAPTQYFTHPITGAQYYVWELTPLLAGTVEGFDTLVTVTWNAGFNGQATLKVAGMNENGTGPDSEELNIAIYDIPNAVLTLADTSLCSGDSTTFNLSLTGLSPWHIIINFSGYPVEMDLFKAGIDSVITPPLYQNLDVEIISLTDASGCINTVFEPLTIEVKPQPGVPVTPSGPANVDTYVLTESVYSTSASNASSYLWNLTPAEAGTIISGASEQSCTVQWNQSFVGQATLTVKAINECGISDDSPEFQVAVASSFGIPENAAGIGISLFPNPSDGTFMISLESSKSMRVSLSIFNAHGKKVFEKRDITVKGILSMPLNLKELAEGMYVIKIQTEKGTVNRKIIIDK